MLCFRIFDINGISLDFVLGGLFVICLLVLAVVDARTREIPFSINLILFVLGVVKLIVHPDMIVTHIIGFLVVSMGLGVIYLVSKGNLIGGGDVKLMATAGLFLGWEPVLVGFFLGCSIGAVLHLIRMWLFKAGREFALGPYLAAGLMISYLYGEKFIILY